MGTDTSEEAAMEEEDETYSNIMVDKVALNLPVVMSKRNNAKISQDNPCLEIFMGSGECCGKCRLCPHQDVRFNLNSQERAISSHFLQAHAVSLQVERKRLYHELRFDAKNSKYKRCFLCSYCGKEFTTKFNVRRHQMLYCPRKSEIDPHLLGLKPGQADPSVISSEAAAEVPVDDTIQDITADAINRLDQIEKDIADENDDDVEEVEIQDPENDPLA